MSTSDPGLGPEEYASEEELRAAYEQEIKRLRVEHVLLENVVTLINLGMRRTGLMAGTEDERDPEQVRLAVESVRALLPLLEPSSAAEQLEQIRQALSQLQMAYVQVASGGAGDIGEGDPPPPRPAPARPAPEAPEAEGKGPAQSSGRLWIPGQ
jgi:hypothetical protein